MAGGTFTNYSKIRPGAYINFKPALRQESLVGTRGIVTIPMELPWGNETKPVEILSTDMTSGELERKIGLKLADDAAQPLREALKNAVTALVYRINHGGTVASATVSTDVIATAKHSGAFGNKISVKMEPQANGKVAVSTLVDGVEKDRQAIANTTEFVANDYITLTGEGSLVTTAGMLLTGGSNGTVSDENYSAYLEAMEGYKWHAMAIPTASATLPQTVAAYIKRLRENTSSKPQAIVLNYPEADYEGIISVSQGYVSRSGEVVEPEMFVCYAAGVTAGAAVNQSNTYHVVSDAVEIIGRLNESAIEQALQNGQMVLSVRQDGAIVIEKDINTLKTFTEKRSYDFSKNRVIRCLDDIATQTSLRFETKYVGKVDNNYSGRAILKGDIIGYFNSLLEIGAIRDFDSATDIEVLPGPDIESVIVNVSVWPVDAMEKLYMTVTLL